jgi:hypothetical protein
MTQIVQGAEILCQYEVMPQFTGRSHCDLEKHANSVSLPRSRPSAIPMAGC